MERIIRRIKENDPGLTELDFSPSLFVAQDTPSLEEFVAALPTNQMITSANVILRFLYKLQIYEQIQLCEAIGSLPNLQSLRFGSSGLTGLPLRLLVRILSMTKSQQQFRSLTIHSIHLHDNICHKNPKPSNANDEEYLEFRHTL